MGIATTDKHNNNTEADKDDKEAAENQNKVCGANGRDSQTLYPGLHLFFYKVWMLCPARDKIRRHNGCKGLSHETAFV